MIQLPVCSRAQGLLTKKPQDKISFLSQKKTLFNR